MGKPHGNSRLAKIGIPVLRRKTKGGARKGNRNAFKHGGFSAEAAAKRAEIQALMQETEDLIARIEAQAMEEANTLMPGKPRQRCILATRGAKVTG